MDVYMHHPLATFSSSCNSYPEDGRAGQIVQSRSDPHARAVGLGIEPLVLGLVLCYFKFSFSLLFLKAFLKSLVKCHRQKQFQYITTYSIKTKEKTTFFFPFF